MKVEFIRSASFGAAVRQPGDVLDLPDVPAKALLKGDKHGPFVHKYDPEHPYEAPAPTAEVLDAKDALIQKLQEQLDGASSDSFDTAPVAEVAQGLRSDLTKAAAADALDAWLGSFAGDGEEGNDEE